MAEINIERKERTTATWVWVVIGVLLLALLAWWLFARDGARDFIAQDSPGILSPIMPGVTDRSATEEFVVWVDENRAREEMDVDHRYTAEGLEGIADALEEIADRRNGVAQQQDTAQRQALPEPGREQLRMHADRIREFADSLQQDEDSARHANHARMAFTHAAQGLEYLEQHHQRGTQQVQQVRQAATAVQPNVPLTQQRQRVQQFFDRASTALQQFHHV
ncbi:MAG TPA: hypothetical protein VMM18_02990 [Gemmatimonadaceae bacterium]|nr:hypothetical protein [Gemmatimonadaceae bacterium]